MIWVRGVVLFAIGLMLVEVLLRLRFGFGNPLLYIADSQIGYLLAPNQTVRRFGNRIEINAQSMRSGQIAEKPAFGMRRVLMIGDSIVNGGWWTDQSETLSALLTQPTLEVLNASANSWSPRNELAYLKRFGTFNADVIVLVINTDDLFGTAPTTIPVGRDRNYPDRKPISAIVEVIQRYVLPASSLPELEQVQAEPGDRVGFNLAAIREIRAIARQHGAKFVLAMTPLLRELTPPGSRAYELTARQRLREMTQSEEIHYIDFLPIFAAEPPESLYRDHIHLSSKGNQLVCDRIRQAIAADY